MRMLSQRRRQYWRAERRRYERARLQAYAKGEHCEEEQAMGAREGERDGEGQERGGCGSDREWSS